MIMSISASQVQVVLADRGASDDMPPEDLRTLEKLIERHRIGHQTKCDTHSVKSSNIDMLGQRAALASSIKDLERKQRDLLAANRELERLITDLLSKCSAEEVKALQAKTLDDQYKTQAEDSTPVQHSTRVEHTVKWFESTVTVPPQARELLENYSHLAADEVQEHVIVLVSVTSFLAVNFG